MALNVTGYGVALRAGLSAAPEPRRRRVSAIRLQSHNARGGGGHFAGSSHPVGEAVSEAGHGRHGRPMIEVRPSVRFDGRGGSAPRSSDHPLGEVVHVAPQAVFRPHRSCQHRRRPDEPVPANAPLASYGLALTVRVERTAADATGAASPIPARRRTAARAVFPLFPETGAPSASSIGTV